MGLTSSVSCQRRRAKPTGTGPDFSHYLFEGVNLELISQPESLIVSSSLVNKSKLMTISFRSEINIPPGYIWIFFRDDYLKL